MTLTYRPLLAVQRELYALPRGLERFRAYIETLRDGRTGDLALPLVAMNPMGRDHVPTLIDEYLALDADAIGADAVREAAVALAGADGRLEAALVVSDDLKGGWTNRWASEFGHRFECQAMVRRGWAVGILWTSEPPSKDAAREAVLTSIFRAAHIARHGVPRTLGDMLTQEGRVMAEAGCGGPRLESEDLEYSRDVITPRLAATDRATQMACVFGDSCARALGYEPQGLSDRAGLAVALADARAALGS